MNRLNGIRASKDGPVIPKGHKKQLNIWDEGNDKPATPPDMKNYPTDSEMCEAWSRGISIAQSLCKEVGMVPEREPINDVERLSKKFSWFHVPHLMAKDAEIMASMLDEDEENDEEEEDEGLAIDDE